MKWIALNLGGLYIYSIKMSIPLTNIFLLFRIKKVKRGLKHRYLFVCHLAISLKPIYWKLEICYIHDIVSN